MTKAEAAQIIDVIRQSLREQPDQFNLQLTVNVTTPSVTGYQANAPTSISAHGGGPGSRTTGLNVSASFGDISGVHFKIKQQANQQATQQLTQNMDFFLNALDSISLELQAEKPNPSRLEVLFTSIKNTWAPGVLSSIIGNVLTPFLTTA